LPAIAPPAVTASAVAATLAIARPLPIVLRMVPPVSFAI
jgi:hypothetical protein